MRSATLDPPFACLTTEYWVSMGAAGHVYVISTNVIFKCPTLIRNPAPEHLESVKESVEKMEREKWIYELLRPHPHPNLLRAILCVPEGMFMPRMQSTLEVRISAPRCSTLKDQFRWIKQLVSVVKWLEHLGYAHGDLRPANILIDAEDSIKIGDFDATIKYGEEYLVGGAPFVKMEGDYDIPPASTITEQHAVGSNIYYIRNGFEPLYDVPRPDQVKRMMSNEFPYTSDDVIFGEIIMRCWHGYYSSIQELENAISDIIQSDEGVSCNINIPQLELPLSKENANTEQDLLAECESFLWKNRISPSL